MLLYPSNLGAFANTFSIKSRLQDSNLLSYLEEVLFICQQISGIIEHTIRKRLGVVGRKYITENLNQVYNE